MSKPQTTSRRLAPGHYLVTAPNANRYEVEFEEEKKEWRVYRVYDANTHTQYDRDMTDCWEISTDSKWRCVEWIAYMQSSPLHKAMYLNHYYAE